MRKMIMLSCHASHAVELTAEPSFDVFSLGVMLFELSAGRNLFKQDISDDNMGASREQRRERRLVAKLGLRF